MMTIGRVERSASNGRRMFSNIESYSFASIFAFERSCMFTRRTEIRLFASFVALTNSQTAAGNASRREFFAAFAASRTCTSSVVSYPHTSAKCFRAAPSVMNCPVPALMASDGTATMNLLNPYRRCSSKIVFV